MATGLSIEPPTPWSMAKNAISQLEAGSDAAEQRGGREHDQAHANTRRRPSLSAHRPGQHQQARERQRVGVQRSTARPDTGGVQLAPDRGERDVDDRVVEADDQQAHAADREHQPPAPAGQLELWLARHRCGFAGIGGHPRPPDISCQAPSHVPPAAPPRRAAEGRRPGSPGARVARALSLSASGIHRGSRAATG